MRLCFALLKKKKRKKKFNRRLLSLNPATCKLFSWNYTKRRNELLCKLGRWNKGTKKEKIMRELIQDVLAHSRDRSSSIIDESEWQ